MTFQIHALPYADFAPYFEMTDADLAAAHGRRVIADGDHGFPCRVSLAEAKTGEELVLVNHVSMDKPSPYRASHAVFVRKNALQASPAPGVVPQSLKDRLLSARAFDGAGMMIDEDVCDGEEIAPLLEKMLEEAAVAEIHLHNARPGCFAARVTRA